MATTSRDLKEQQDFQVLFKQANEGDAEAQAGLAACYYWGKGIQKDAAQGESWMRLAAQNGSTTALYAFSVMHRMGKDYADRPFTQDLVESARYLRKAAEGGDSLALNELIRELTNGSDRFKKDEIEAEHWRKALAEKDAAKIKPATKTATTSGEVKIRAEVKTSQDKPLIFSVVSQVPKPAKNDFQLSTEELRKFAEAGNPSAQLILGLRIWTGTDGCITNWEGQNWIIKAAQSKDTPAGLCAQGLCFEKAFGDVKIMNNERAKECYRKAIEQGYIPAIYQLGHMLRVEGITTSQSTITVHAYNKWPQQGTETYTHKDQEKLRHAINFFTACAEAGYTPAYNLLADGYFNGNGVQENKAEAFRLFKLGADSGDCAAKRNLGMCYEYGYGVKADKSEARRWYREAEAQNYSNIKEDLRRVSTCIIM